MVWQKSGQDEAFYYREHLGVDNTVRGKILQICTAEEWIRSGTDFSDNTGKSGKHYPPSSSTEATALEKIVPRENATKKRSSTLVGEEKKENCS